MSLGAQEELSGVRELARGRAHMCSPSTKPSTTYLLQGQEWQYARKLQHLIYTWFHTDSHLVRVTTHNIYVCVGNVIWCKYLKILTIIQFCFIYTYCMKLPFTAYCKYLKCWIDKYIQNNFNYSYNYHSPFTAFANKDHNLIHFIFIICMYMWLQMCTYKINKASQYYIKANSMLCAEDN